MGIKLVFTIQREAFYIEIANREIFYGDRIWKNKVRVIPPDEEIRMKIIKGRNKYGNLTLQQFEQFFNLNEEEMKEYEAAKTDEELADICIRDVKKKGGVLRKRE